MGSAGNRRYYLDATLTPALMPGTDGTLTEIMHQVMVYHKEGEEVIDYLSGDPAHGYRVPLTRTEDKIEVTTEKELVEKDVEIQSVVREKTGVYRIQVRTSGKDSFGKDLTDGKTSLTLNFIVKLPEKDHVLTEKEIQTIGNANVWGYQEGDRISRVHWNLYAATGGLWVRKNEEEEEERVKIGLSLDDIEKDRISDYMAAFYSISFFLKSQGVIQEIYYGEHKYLLCHIEQYEELFTDIFCGKYELSSDPMEHLYKIPLCEKGQDLQKFLYDMEL